MDTSNRRKILTTNLPIKNLEPSAWTLTENWTQAIEKKKKIAHKKFTNKKLPIKKSGAKRSSTLTEKGICHSASHLQRFWNWQIVLSRQKYFIFFLNNIRTRVFLAILYGLLKFLAMFIWGNHFQPCSYNISQYTIAHCQWPSENLAWFYWIWSFDWNICKEPAPLGNDGARRNEIFQEFDSNTILDHNLCWWYSLYYRHCRSRL